MEINVNYPRTKDSWVVHISRLLGHSKIEQTVKYLKLTTKELANSLKDNPYFTGIEKASENK